MQGEAGPRPSGQRVVGSMGMEIDDDEDDDDDDDEDVSIYSTINGVPIPATVIFKIVTLMENCNKGMGKGRKGKVIVDPQ